MRRETNSSERSDGGTVGGEDSVRSAKNTPSRCHLPFWVSTILASKYHRAEHFMIEVPEVL